MSGTPAANVSPPIVDIGENLTEMCPLCQDSLLWVKRPQGMMRFAARNGALAGRITRPRLGSLSQKGSEIARFDGP